MGNIFFDFNPTFRYYYILKLKYIQRVCSNKASCMTNTNCFAVTQYFNNNIWMPFKIFVSTLCFIKNLYCSSQTESLTATISSGTDIILGDFIFEEYAKKTDKEVSIYFLHRTYGSLSKLSIENSSRNSILRLIN